MVYKNQGEFDKALIEFKRALFIRESIVLDSLTIATSYNNIGEVYKNQGKLDEALIEYKKTLAIQEIKAPDSLAIATSYNNVGEVYSSQNNFDEASIKFKQALKIRERDLIESHPHLVISNRNIAETLLRL